jgi:hypothetical protein
MRREHVAFGKKEDAIERLFRTVEQRTRHSTTSTTNSALSDLSLFLDADVADCFFNIVGGYNLFSECLGLSPKP